MTLGNTKSLRAVAFKRYIVFYVRLMGGVLVIVVLSTASGDVINFNLNDIC